MLTVAWRRVSVVVRSLLGATMDVGVASAAFDPFDWEANFFSISRDDARLLLERADMAVGAFVVRGSSTSPGDYVLCVKELDGRVSNFLIRQVQHDDGQHWYHIGQQTFVNMGQLLNYYKMHCIDTTSLTGPAPRRRLKAKAQFRFDGQEPTDLSFKKGDILWVVDTTDNDWWTASDEFGKSGQIPANHVQLCDASDASPSVTSPQPARDGRPLDASPSLAAVANGATTPPKRVRVVMERVPSAYDKSALRLRVGDVIEVTKADLSGTWEGRCDGRVGTFPFTYVEVLDVAVD